MKMTEKDMTFRGIVRRIDELGRLVIPKEFRTELGIEPCDELEMFLTEEGGVYVKKVKREDEI